MEGDASPAAIGCAALIWLLRVGAPVVELRPVGRVREVGRGTPTWKRYGCVLRPRSIQPASIKTDRSIIMRSRALNS